MKSLATREGFNLNVAFAGISDKAVRMAVLELVKSIAQQTSRSGVKISE